MLWYDLNLTYKTNNKVYYYNWTELNGTNGDYQYNGSIKDQIIFFCYINDAGTASLYEGSTVTLFK